MTTPTRVRTQGRMLIKAALDKPFRWETFIPGLVALLASGLLRWLF